MSRVVTVGPGDCLVNLSVGEGFFWKTIWNHAENAALRMKRKHHNILKDGDKLFIPDRQIKWYMGSTENRHVFVRRGVPTAFDLTLAACGRPRSGERYVLILDTGVLLEGTTDGDGRLSHRIPPQVQEGRLLVGDSEEEILIRFGYMDPIAEVTGVQTRLRNLGLYEGEVDGEMNAETVAAIAEFNRAYEIPGEGQLSDQTRQRLVAAHGS